MVSMKDIACRCNVSVATVSKALSGQHDIGEETRIRIERVAEEMGYLANSAARTLKTNKSNNIGVLFVDGMHTGLAHEYFSMILESINSAAETFGYDITFINPNVGGNSTSYLQHCRYRGMDGVIIVSVDFHDSRVLELVRSGIPLVSIDHEFANHSAVLSDNERGITELVQYVYRRGHRKIAYLHGENTEVTKKRLLGFSNVCKKLGLDIPKEYIRECAYHDPARCQQVTEEVLSLSDRPTCIIFPDDYSYIGGLNAISHFGLSVPEDISAVGYDGIHLAQVLDLTTYAQNAQQFGVQAVRELIRQIDDPSVTFEERVTVFGMLLEGKTVRQI